MMKGYDIIVNKWILIIKTIFVFVICFITVIYFIKTVDLSLINIAQLNSIVLFLNDTNSNSNIIEYITMIIIKFIFNVDIHNLKSFFENINPLLK